MKLRSFQVDDKISRISIFIVTRPEESLSLSSQFLSRHFHLQPIPRRRCRSRPNSSPVLALSNQKSTACTWYKSYTKLCPEAVTIAPWSGAGGKKYLSVTFQGTLSLIINFYRISNHAIFLYCNSLESLSMDVET